MDTTSSNKGKGVMNQAPAPTTMPYSQSYMAPPNTIYGEPLDVALLTVAKPGEPVDHTPSSILNHKAYKGGWKVLRYPRPDGRVDKTYNHKDFGKLRSKVAVIDLLDKLWMLQQNEKLVGSSPQETAPGHPMVPVHPIKTL
ncbi:hypothetical protein PVAP13_5KG234200 [Panicum virgatum]|uniref:Uncharacterized protein n=1 Tax=Panicum virgatum TaxID=38727 RepID=A0A8T0SKW2_PANVG|nr:hypothetical protein PVAP13_5KG234200 [Panicum virgatum]